MPYLIAARHQREQFGAERKLSEHPDIHGRSSINFWAIGVFPFTRVHTLEGRKSLLGVFFPEFAVLFMLCSHPTKKNKTYDIVLPYLVPLVRFWSGEGNRYPNEPKEPVCSLRTETEHFLG